MKNTLGRGGALLVNKPTGMSSFGVIEELKSEFKKISGLKKKELPKIGHGGTLDPFATGLLVVVVGEASKLARYFLGATKSYRGKIKFGETTIPGDPTDPISETTSAFPKSLKEIQEKAKTLTLQPYHQIPPMHSAKKHHGKPLYKLARDGIEVEREPKVCHLYQFEIHRYQKPFADFDLICSSGTYVRSLAQDLGKLLGSLGYLTELERFGSGSHSLKNAMGLFQIKEKMRSGTPWPELPCWIPFDDLLSDYDAAEASSQETTALLRGRQRTLIDILGRSRSEEKNGSAPIPKDPSRVVIYHQKRLIAVAHQNQSVWKLERVFKNSFG